MKHALIPVVAILLSGCGSQQSVMSPGGESTTAPRSGGVQINRSLIIPAGQFARKNPERLRPRYITIHSTQSYSAGATALTHAKGQYAGAFTARYNKIGYLSWHFTVDDHSIYQSLPLDEQGQHADYEGPGNDNSIGIELCENAGGNWSATLDKGARLTAQLMREYNIPISNVVPHMHWRQIRYKDGKDLGYKQCPKPLLDGGKLGPKWNAFLSKAGELPLRQYGQAQSRGDQGGATPSSP